jgi:hypothetical protein
MTKDDVLPNRFASGLKISDPKAWNVPMKGLLPNEAGSWDDIRSRISRAALLVKVIAQIAEAATPDSMR